MLFAELTAYHDHLCPRPSRAEHGPDGGFVRRVEERRPQTWSGVQQPADDRVPPADFDVAAGVVVQRQHPGDLPAHDIWVSVTVQHAVHSGHVLTHLDTDLVGVTVDAEGQAQHALPLRGCALPEVKAGRLGERERPLGGNSERCHRQTGPDSLAGLVDDRRELD